MMMLAFSSKNQNLQFTGPFKKIRQEFEIFFFYMFPCRYRNYWNEIKKFFRHTKILDSTYKYKSVILVYRRLKEYGKLDVVVRLNCAKNIQ